LQVVLPEGEEDPLTLRKSFDMLTFVGVANFGEALIPDQHINASNAGQLAATQLEDLDIHIEIVCSLCDTSSEVDLDKLKAWVDTPVLTPMSQPITTSYASLTTDKLPSSQTLVPAFKSSFHSAAALKSVHILSKFWGDDVEEVEKVMEDTLSHDKRLEMEDYPSISKSTKEE